MFDACDACNRYLNRVALALDSIRNELYYTVHIHGHPSIKPHLSVAL